MRCAHLQGFWCAQRTLRSCPFLPLLSHLRPARQHAHGPRRRLRVRHRLPAGLPGGFRRRDRPRRAAGGGPPDFRPEGPQGSQDTAVLRSAAAHPGNSRRPDARGGERRHRLRPQHQRRPDAHRRHAGGAVYGRPQTAGVEGDRSALGDRERTGPAVDPGRPYGPARAAGSRGGRARPRALVSRCRSAPSGCAGVCVCRVRR